MTSGCQDRRSLRPSLTTLRGQHLAYSASKWKVSWRPGCFLRFYRNDTSVLLEVTSFVSFQSQPKYELPSPLASFFRPSRFSWQLRRLELSSYSQTHLFMSHLAAVINCYMSAEQKTLKRKLSKREFNQPVTGSEANWNNNRVRMKYAYCIALRNNDLFFFFLFLPSARTF